MGGRRPLDLGTAGGTRFYYRHDNAWHPYHDKLPSGVRPDKWRAMTLFRDHDGHTRQVERTGASKSDAQRKLTQALRDRGQVSKTGVLANNSRVEEAAELWLSKVTANGATATTVENYRRRLRIHVLPGLGKLLIRECDVAHLDAYFESLARDGVAAETRRGIRTVVSGILAVAQTHRVIAHNPVHELGRIRGAAVSPAEAMPLEHLVDFLQRMDGDEAACGLDLPDYVRFLFGTGVRFGEALAVRWREVNLSDESITVDGKTIPPQSCWINGNIVVVTGQGVIRHDGKSASANRIVGLPEFLYRLLLVRKPLEAYDDEPVFPSPTLGWKHPSNVQRSVRELRNRIGYPGFTTHVGRKTVATVLDDAGQSPRQVADQLGHADPGLTMKRYMGRGQANAAAAAALDAPHRSQGLDSPAG